MGSFQWFIVALIVMAGLGYWNYQRIDGQRKQLVSAGFQISDDLKGNPGLLVSTTQRQVAVLVPSGYLRLGFDQLKDAEVRFRSSAETETDYRIALILEGAPVPEVEIRYSNEHSVEIALRKLQQLTGL
ncbi:hypothetical protein [Amphritea pacifica]|uniref:Uncharacterized protein n=1 Tax=Amphritea pacifica TaxID=2811233 RepID=A0ABS2WB64_9GAMM|nr:hypothetical protein [Amphritea pacifica]MBN0988836.1 hypothetical protein [Amphritea pacifica]MBN1006298.1 hypothetical protein [Amphritea pacifica]